jgi:hypothetical protein
MGHARGLNGNKNGVDDRINGKHGKSHGNRREIRVE